MNFTKLQTAVLTQMDAIDLDQDDKATLENIVNHGIDGGFNGFVWYTETVQFFDDNREIILQSLIEDADSMDIQASEMVKSFRCLQINSTENWNHEIDCVLMGIECEEDQMVKNALAWYAGETVARQIVEA